VTRSVRLRPWQKAALAAFEASEGRDFLAVATPGAGKTTFALTVAVHQLAAPDGPRRLIVVAPTAHLKRQWATAAARFGVHLDPLWSAGDGGLPPDMHGIVTTYQQVAATAPVLAGLSRHAMVIFDEIHHAGDDRAWGESVQVAFEGARRRLSLSGTPFRSDTRAIPFLRYELDLARPDFEYGYGQALRDGRVVRPVYFPRTNGHMEWSAPDGSVHEASFDDPLDQVRANQRLRTALSLEGDWLPTVLRSAHERLVEIRATQPDAGGLVIATDQDHARGIADALRWRHGVQAVVATSDDAGASDRIAAFAASDAPWLVAVRMVSEGVDIPRLRVGVYATTTTTELFFRQAVGRLVRWTVGVPGQRSYLWIPDDARLRARAFQIAEVRRHSLRKETATRPAPDPAELDAQRDAPDRGAGQLSLFAVISAVATGTDTHGAFDDGGGRSDDDRHADDHPDGRDPDGRDALGGRILDGGVVGTDDPGIGAGEALPAVDADDSDDLTVALPALRDAGGTHDAGGGPAGDGPLPTRREQKQRLRDANAELARALVHKTGWSHAQVNAELNRLTGLRRITEATMAQLETRRAHGERWLTRL
jgi:superfamily II DNA or RNA helicase